MVGPTSQNRPQEALSLWNAPGTDGSAMTARGTWEGEARHATISKTFKEECDTALMETKSKNATEVGVIFESDENAADTKSGQKMAAAGAGSLMADPTVHIMPTNDQVK